MSYLSSHYRQDPGMYDSAGVPYSCSEDLLNLVLSQVDLVEVQGSKILINIFQSVYNSFRFIVHRTIVWFVVLISFYFYLQGLAH